MNGKKVICGQSSVLHCIVPTGNVGVAMTTGKLYASCQNFWTPQHPGSDTLGFSMNAHPEAGHIICVSFSEYNTIGCDYILPNIRLNKGRTFQTACDRLFC